MASVLGKRARTTDLGADTSPSRVKRRAQPCVANDENIDPIAFHSVRGSNKSDRTGLDELGLPICTFKSASPSRVALGGKRAALSPTKSNVQSEYYEELPKKDNVVQLLTPKTPRHRDTLSKRVPITPCHRSGLLKKPLTTATPRTPSTPGNVPTVYHYARQLFTSSADPGLLIGREKERRELEKFIEEGIQSKTGRCLYVSGPPGTGKSALVNEICRNVKRLDNVMTAHINCMTAQSSRDIYGKLNEELVRNESRSEVELARLRSIFVPKETSRGPIYVVTLDEIDHILNLDLEILYTLFEWSLHRLSRLIIIGIANALDLTDRFLPRLKARNLKPQFLPFLPYTAPQIASVIMTKLKSLSLAESAPPADYIPFIHPTAIQLCAKKVASQSGDLRKAFDLIRRTIDLVETETKHKFRDDLLSQPTPMSPCSPKTPLGENPNLRSPCRATLATGVSLATLTPLTAPRATIAHASKVSATTLSHGTSQRIQALNLQQRAILCVLISQRKTSFRGASPIFASPSKTYSAPPMRKAFETYCAICRRENTLPPLSNTEFADVISGLETLGLVGEEKGGRSFGVVSATPTRKGRGTREEKRILCFVDEDEMRACLQGVGLEILVGLLNCDARNLN